MVLTDANFDQKTGKGVVLVDFWAAWCPPCRTQGPIVEKIAKRYAGRVTVGKLDVDGNPKTAKRFKIRFIPTLIIFKEGKVHRQLTGLHREKQLADELDAALAKD
ncbi:MAG: thioredoxin [Planctomycetes bacterium SM23_65]|nr:MAG: thioredoxin [Planctomycetes bacterium SM23_65]